MLRCRRIFFRSKLLLLLLCAAAICVYYPFKAVDQRLCACAKCVSEDARLRQLRLNSSFQPFLTADLVLSEDAFSWWRVSVHQLFIRVLNEHLKLGLTDSFWYVRQRLQIEKRSFSAYKMTVNTIFKIFPRNPDVIQPKPDRCITCAVVGNSVNLRGSSYGPLIDSHGIVIRYIQSEVALFKHLTPPRRKDSS